MPIHQHTIVQHFLKQIALKGLLFFVFAIYVILSITCLNANQLILGIGLLSILGIFFPIAYLQSRKVAHYL